ncbi:MAG: LysR family transcriptional regulator [Solobacterium sp.]|nr:LysR family transcriptional regulator [Solobacterium sp.]
MKITPDKFAYLTAVVEEKNITRAAEKLFISQPALSTYINKVENYYNIKIFDRSQNSVTLTYAGERFMREMEKVIRAQQKFDNEMEELANHRAGRLTVGIGNTRGCDWLPYLLPAYKIHFPELDIKIIEVNADMAEQQLMTGTMDFGITTLPIRQLGISYELLYTERIYLIIPQGHTLLEGKDITDNGFDNLLNISSEELNDQIFIVPSEGYGLYRYTRKVFEEYNIVPGDLVEINNSDTAFQLSCYGTGLVLTPESSFLPPKPHTMPVIAGINGKPMERYVVAAYNSSVGLSPFARRVIELTRKIVNNEPKLNVKSYY